MTQIEVPSDIGIFPPIPDEQFAKEFAVVEPSTKVLEAIAWFYGETSSDYTVKQAREFIEKTWGSDVSKELWSIFNRPE